jgi:hypothetical protein
MWVTYGKIDKWHFIPLINRHEIKIWSSNESTVSRELLVADDFNCISSVVADCTILES